MATVRGFIRHHNGAPALGMVVRAFDRDMRSEQLLGQVVLAETSGRYEITYTSRQFLRAEKKSADLVVRVLYPAGNLAAESRVIFNARAVESVDLTIARPVVPPHRALSELETLQASINPVREDVAYLALTDDDLGFLTEELIRSSAAGAEERRSVRERLELLRLGAQFERQTDVLLAAFYGWLRQGLPRALDALVETPSERLREALHASITANIIPDLSGRSEELVERMRALRHTQGRLVPHSFVVRLIGIPRAGAEQPLAARQVDIVDTEADPETRDLGTVVTDRQGFATLGFVLPSDAPPGTTRRLELRIRDEDTTLALAHIDAVANQTETLIVRVPIQPSERELAPVGGFVSPALSSRLRDRGIETLADLLASPGTTDDAEPEALEQLRARAKWTALTPALTEAGQARLVESGIRGPLDVAAEPRAAFVRTHHESLGGDAQTYVHYKAVLDTTRLFQHHVNGVWIDSVTSPGDEDDDDPVIPTGVGDILDALETCGCEDCDSAVSPSAYLAHLLDWVLTHVKAHGATIAFADLADDLHQPFGQLPASCRAVEEQVRQVRLAVEALWRFAGLLDRSDLQLPTPFRNAYRHLRNELYRGILAHLGVGFDQLRQATLQIDAGDAAAQAVMAQREAVAGLLGIDPARVDDLFFNVEQPPISPTEHELEQLFGYRNTRAADVMALPGRPELVNWQREQLEAIWRRQDWSLDAYQGPARLPFVDPDLIDDAFLRTPLEENPALDLLEARRSALTQQRAQMEAFDPRVNGLSGLVQDVLGVPIDTLRLHGAIVQSPDSSAVEIEEAQAAVAALGLTAAGFTHLMQVDARLQAGEPAGASDAETDAAWDAVFDLLSRAHRHSLFSAWVEEEQALGLVMGPKAFWRPIETPVAPNPWRADLAERIAWEEALRSRSRRPVIDPDQIALARVVAILVLHPRPAQGMRNGELLLPPLSAVDLWEARRAFVDERLASLEAAEAGLPSSLSRLAAVLQASTLGINLERIAELALLEDAGTDLASRLAQIGLTLREYRFLADMRLLALANSPISADDRAEVRALLVQAEKRREFAEWRLQEAPQDDAMNGITLHPSRFVIPQSPPPIGDSPEARWLHDAAAHEDWLAVLQARKDQFDALTTALDRAAANAESGVLPLLRNLLIMESVAPGDTLAEKAAWLDRRLLMDMAMDGCQMTTRVSQAIETLQRLVRGVYTEEHIEPLGHLSLDAIEDYESEWGTIGDYRDWRAVMLLYLFPENSLHLVPATKESEALRQLKASLPRDVGPLQACEAAHAFSEYFRNVSTLRSEAACQVLVRIPDACDAGKSDFRVLVFVFARARDTGHVLAAAFLPSYPRDLYYQWSRVPAAGEVERIVGAVPHTISSGKRYIVLFVITEQAGKRSLEFLRFDLDDLVWSKRRALDLPNGISAGFRVAAVQKRPNAYASGLDDFSPASDFPTIVAVEDSSDIIYVRRLDPDALDWDGTDWKPLYGKRAVSAGFLNDPLKLAGVVQNNDEEYVVILEKLFDGDVYYRTLSIDPPGRDDMRWRRIFEIDSCRGALGMPLQPRIAVFANQGAFMRYRTIGVAGDLDGETVYSPWDGFDSEINDAVGTTNIVSRLRARDERLIEFVSDFDHDWLQSGAGVSLDDIDLTGLAVALFVPTAVGEIELQDSTTAEVENADPLGPADPDVERAASTYTVSGSLRDLLELERQNFNPTIPGSARYADKSYYLVQVIAAGVNEFAARMASLGSAGYLDTLGSWRVADEHIRSLSSRTNDSLVDLVRRLARNRIATHLTFLDQWIRVNVDGADERMGIQLYPYQRVAVRHREGSELGAMHSILGNWFLPPLSGDGSFPRGPSATQALVLAQERASYITRFVRQNQQLTYEASYPPARISADNEGPYDIAPQRGKAALALRRAEIRHVYQSDGSALANATLSVRTLLQEAFNLAPIHLGYQLQRNGHYDEALAYFRLVFDDRQSEGERRIDFGLELERDLQLDYDRSEEFLADTTNAHAIAATRKNTYTRQILLLIIRCLIDQADALFTNDTVSDNARARELYTRALDLLNLDVLRPGSSPCPNIIGELDVEIVAPGQVPLGQFAAALAPITDPARLRSVTDRLVAVSAQPGSASARLAEMQRIVASAIDEQPPGRTQAQIREGARATLRTLENLYLAHPRTRTFSQGIVQRRQTVRLVQLAEATGIGEATLAQTALPWLRDPKPQTLPAPAPLALAVAASPAPPRWRISDRIRSEAPLATLNALSLTGFAAPSGVSFQFCIPQNPVIQSLRRRAESNLQKLRTCRNIAGFVRPLDPYGAPIGIGAGVVSPDGSIFTGVVDPSPTIYRFAVLMTRAKELANQAQQIETGYQSALERAENEELSVLHAEHQVELAQARVVLQDLRIVQATHDLGLAQLQRGTAVFREREFSQRIDGDMIDAEKRLLDAYRDAGAAQQAANVARTVGQVAGYTAAAIESTAHAEGFSKIAGAVATGLRSTQVLAAASEGIATGFAINAQTRAQVASFEASFERQKADWELQRGLAALDIRVGDQQIVLAQDQIGVVEQERMIAGLEYTHAADVLRFLVNRTFTEEMYRWIAAVLEDVYRFFLQEAASIARLAERQLAFERQQAPLKLIQSNYWISAAPANVLSRTGSADRLGLTGSARLLKDLYQLDGYAFETRQRKQALTVTLDLAEMYPAEFQQFRETGVLVFETPLALIDRQMPGYYLCLVRQVSVSVIALVPSGGIRATLASAGTSRTVVGGDTFQTVTIRSLPERIALTAAATTSAGMDLEPDAQSLLPPFDGIGFDTFWELRMPKAANPWDYRTMATVLFSVHSSALHSFDYERQVIERIDRKVSFNRAFDFRQVFPDAIYDLNNPELTDTPMSVRFETRRSDFPPNLLNLRIEHVMLYVVRREGELFEQPLRHLLFIAAGTAGPLGGPASTIGGRISTRSGNGASWLPMIGSSPVGRWELAFQHDPPAETEARDRFANGQTENLLLVLTVSGEAPSYT